MIDLARLRGAYAADPSSPARRLALIRALLAHGEPREALELLDPESADADERTCLAAALRAVDRTRRAERILVEIIASNPVHVGALRLLGGILIDRGRPADALEHLLRVRRLASGDAGALALLARAHRHLGQLDLARRTLEDAVSIDPFEGSVHAEFARYWETSEAWELAHESWTLAAELAELPDEDLERRCVETAARAREAGGAP